MNNLAPIVLFCYNRPWHTKQTLDALAKNELAAESDLFVYCDGPKNDSLELFSLIEETRELIDKETRFKRITVIKSKTNKGLADSIINGVTEIVNQFGKIIVLEDDIVTSPGFLKYMNDALELYKKDEKVMHISGYMFPIKSISCQTFFIHPTTCWGWGTWKSSWEYFEKDVNNQIQEIDRKNGWKLFTLNNSYPSYKNQLFLNQSGEINTWAIFWQTSVFLKKGLSLHPSTSFTKNIGLDGSGTNCDKNDFYEVESLNQDINLIKIKIKENKVVLKKIEFYFNSITKSRTISIRDRIYLLRKKIFK